MSRTFEFSLTRWHKVAERLAREISETLVRAQEVIGNTRVSAYLGETQLTSLHAESAESQSRLARAFRLQDALADIRRALGEANAQHGVTQRLADLDKLQRRHKALTSLIDMQGADMVTIDELPNIPEDYVADGDRYDSRRPQFRVRMLDRAAIQKLKDDLEDVRRQTYALADEIADLNRAKLTLGLADDAAELAGL